MAEGRKRPGLGLQKTARAEVDTVEAASGLCAAVADTDPAVRYDAMRALQNLGPRAATVVSALIDGLSDAEQHNRVAAADALGGIGPGA